MKKFRFWRESICFPERSAMKFNEQSVDAYLSTFLAIQRSYCLRLRDRRGRKLIVKAARMQFPLRFCCKFLVFYNTALACISSLLRIGMIFTAFSNLFVMEANYTYLYALKPNSLSTIFSFSSIIFLMQLTCSLSSECFLIDSSRTALFSVYWISSFACFSHNCQYSVMLLIQSIIVLASSDQLS